MPFWNQGGGTGEQMRPVEEGGVREGKTGPRRRLSQNQNNIHVQSPGSLGH